MKELNEESFNTAITLGNAVCNELSICCEKRGQVIFRIYKKLEELKPKKPVATELSGNQDSTQVEE